MSTWYKEMREEVEEQALENHPSQGKRDEDNDSSSPISYQLRNPEDD